jgi:hypothetical protein
MGGFCIKHVSLTKARQSFVHQLFPSEWKALGIRHMATFTVCTAHQLSHLTLHPCASNTSIKINTCSCTNLISANLASYNTT